jgi:hypothetical protein
MASRVSFLVTDIEYSRRFYEGLKLRVGWAALEQIGELVELVLLDDFLRR